MPAGGRSGSDKLREKQRYERRAREASAPRVLGSSAMPPFLRAPYLAYEEAIRNSVDAGERVLEIAAGTGLHTGAFVDAGALVVATDISGASLRHLAGAFPSVAVAVADMEALPFLDSCFDVVAMAGSLSYGDTRLVASEVRRVLRQSGMFLCVDSLNHNPVYRINRRINYWRGNRTASTLRNMPTLASIEEMAGHFECHDVRYFGSASWAMPLVARVSGGQFAATLSDRIDDAIGVRRSAFKFVLRAVGLRK